MIRGPKPQPTASKVVRGNPGKRPLNGHEPKPPRGIGPAPEHLSDEGLAEWVRVSGDLNRAGILTMVDSGALAAYCQAYGRWVQAENALAKVKNGADGLVIKTQSGNLIQNPLVGIANKAMADMVRYAAEFGMTPSARTRISAIDGGDEDAFYQFEQPVQ